MPCPATNISTKPRRLPHRLTRHTTPRPLRERRRRPQRQRACHTSPIRRTDSSLPPRRLHTLLPPLPATRRLLTTRPPTRAPLRHPSGSRHILDTTTTARATAPRPIHSPLPVFSRLPLHTTPLFSRCRPPELRKPRLTSSHTRSLTATITVRTGQMVLAQHMRHQTPRRPPIRCSHRCLSGQITLPILPPSTTGPHGRTRQPP